MSYPYPVSVIPGPNDLLSLSQGQIQTNFANLLGWSGVDHVAYGDTNAGQHEQVSFPTTNVPGGVSAGLTSIFYSAPGVANSAAAQLFFQNSLGNFLISGIRAYGFAAGGVIASQSFNVASIVRVAAGTYNVTLTSNAVSSANFGVLVSSIMQSSFTGGVFPGYVITGTGTFQLNFRGLTGPLGIDPTNYTFIVFQI